MSEKLFKFRYKPRVGDPIVIEVPGGLSRDEIVEIGEKKAEEQEKQKTLSTELESPNKDSQFGASTSEQPKFAERESYGPLDMAQDAGEAVLGGVGAVLNKLDQYTGAAKGRSEFYDYLARKHGKAQKNYSYGQDTDNAASGKEIAHELGFSDASLSDAMPGMYSDTGNEWLKFKKGGFLDPTVSGTVGLGIDTITDPMVLLSSYIKPANLIKKGYAGVVQEMNGIPRRVSRTLLEAKPASKLGHIPGISTVQSGVKSVGDALSESERPFIKNIGNKLNNFGDMELRDPISSLYKRYGSDFDEAAKDTRNIAKRRMLETKGSLGEDLKSSINSATNQAVSVPVTDAVNEIDKIIFDLPVTAVAEKKELLELKGLLENPLIKRPNGEISLKEADYIKSKLQQAAEPMYQDKRLVKGRDNVARGAKQAARVLRKNIIDRLEKAGDTKYADAYKLYEYLHQLEKHQGMKALLSDKELANKWYTAGAGESSQAFSNVKRLDDWLEKANWKNRVKSDDLIKGSDKTLQNMAEELAAYKYYGNPSFLPVDTTGKAVARQYAGNVFTNLGTSALGYGVGGPVGGAATLALTSPKAAKFGATLLKTMNNKYGYMAGRIQNQQDNAERFSKKISRAVLGTKYEQQFRDAANKGEGSVNATFFKTYLSDPEFQQRFRQVDENSEDLDELKNQMGQYQQNQEGDLEDLLVND